MPQTSHRIAWVDHLRGFVVLLVVAHHSALAYTSFASFHSDVYILSTHPVVDSTRSVVLDYFEDLNDIYFMSLMFLVSGIFAWRSLENRDRRQYVKQRFVRLFLPFLAGVTILMPVAYYPSWMEAHGKGGWSAFLLDFFTTEGWPAGVCWFLWALFSFDVTLAFIYPRLRDFMQWAGDSLPAVRTGMEILLLAYIITWVLYVPLMLWTGPDSWKGIGPFDIQVSRVLLYFGYFLLGGLIGRKGLLEGIFSEEAVFMRKWAWWAGGALLVYLVLKFSEFPLKWMVSRHIFLPQRAHWLYRSLWSLSCALSSMACLAVFRRFSQKASCFWDSLADNAFNIYLLHYPIVIWCQWLLLGIALPAMAKFGISFIVATGGSWMLSLFIRRLRAALKPEDGQSRRFAGFFR